jgi:glycosyltransferase involved in cell wall biosynthesis
MEELMQFPLSYAVMALLALALLIQVYYFLRFFSLLAFSKNNDNKQTVLPVSIVICAKNEAANLHKNLHLFFEQDYPEFEVVVVNDCSYDESEDILDEFQKKYPNLHVVNLKEEEIKEHDKKLALTLGIKGAKYNQLLLTDADCVPANKFWLKTMAGNFSQEKEIVLGYGAYQKQNGWLNKLIRYDTFFAALQFLSFAKGKRPYMGIGRNLAYTKELFFKNKGFAAHYHIQSGDDDLFINKVGTAKNISVELKAESFTYSEPKKSYATWVTQKRRHLTTAKHYKFSDKMRLGIYVFSQYLFFLSFAALAFSSINIYVLLGIYVCRLLLQLIIFGKAMEKLHETDLLFFSPIFELVLLVIYPFMHSSNLFVTKHKWK